MHSSSSDTRALSSYEESYSCFPGREKAEIRNKTQKKKAFSLYAEVHRMYILDKPSFCD